MKYILLFVFVLLQITHVAAQEGHFGIRLGPSLTNLGGKEGVQGANYITGYHVGIYYNVMLGNRLSIEPGLQYAQKGSKSDVDQRGFSSTVKNNYIDAPLLLRYNLLGPINIFGGLQPSVLVSSALILDERGNKDRLSGRDVKSLWQDFDFASVVGVGAEVFKGFNVQVSYDHGLVNVSEISNAVSNRGFKFSVGKSF